MLTNERGSTREVLRQYEDDHRVLLKKLEAIRKVLQQKQSAPSTEVVTQALRSRPSPSIASPPTPPNHDSHSGDAQQEPHIVSPLSEEAAKWLKGNDPTIMSACESIKEGAVLAAKASIDAVCARHGLTSTDLQNQIDVLGLDIETIDKDAAHVQQMLADMADDEGWTVSYNHELRVLYRHHRSSAVHSVKLQAEFEAPLWHVMALMVEFDLTKTWNAFMLDTTILYAKLPLLTCIYGALWTPFFLFDATVKAEAFDVGLVSIPSLLTAAHPFEADPSFAQEDKSVVVRLSDIPKEELEHYELPPAHKRRRRASVGWGSCFRLEALPPTVDGKHRVRASAIAHLNPHLPFVPGFLVNFVLKVASPFGFRMMKKVLNELFKEPNSIFNERIAMRPEVYQFCKDKTKALMKHFYGIDIDV